jgi:hypothetical protein
MDMRQLAIQEPRAAGEKSSVEEMRRPAIKLPPQPPTILICVPIGSKGERRSFDVPPCKDAEGKVIETCLCPNHGRKVATSFYNQGLVPAEWAINLANLVTPLNTTIGYLMEKGRLSAEARNRMTIRAIEIGAKYVFYWDDDVVLHPHTLYAMHGILETQPDIGLISAVLVTREDPVQPYVYRTQGEGAWWGFSIDPEDPPEDIHAAGGGCLMVRVEDLMHMTPPYWIDEQIIHDNNVAQWGHDIRFIKNFREQTGKRTVVKGHLLCQHVDVDRNRIYELPPDSEPYRRLQERQGKAEVVEAESAWAEIQESPPLTLPFLDEQLKASHSKRRMFVIEKKDQSDEDLRKILGERFGKASIYSMDEKWVAIGEELLTLSGGNGNA